MKSKAQPAPRRFSVFKLLFAVALAAIAVYILAKNWATVTQALSVAKDSYWRWFALTLVLLALTFGIAAGIYNTLALHQLRYRNTFLVAVASAFANRLVPAGLGSLGLNGLYLYRARHTPAEATAVVSVNNLMGITAHLALLLCLGLWQPQVLRQLVGSWHVGLPLLIAAVVLAGICLALLLQVRVRVGVFMYNLLRSLHKIGTGRATRALLLSVCMTAVYTLMLFTALRAVGAHLGLLETFIVFSIGMLAGTATPTPGGLVGAEAGLFTGFVAYHVPSAEAGAAVLLYRLATYWLPLVPGVLALAKARDRRLL